MEGVEMLRDEYSSRYGRLHTGQVVQVTHVDAIRWVTLGIARRCGALTPTVAGDVMYLWERSTPTTLDAKILFGESKARSWATAQGMARPRGWWPVLKFPGYRCAVMIGAGG